jgi:hypothetical protein
VSTHPGTEAMDINNKAKSMHSDEYYRLHTTRFVMARQSDLADMRTRWLNMAQDCLKLANTDGMQRGTASRVAGSKLARKRKLEGVHQEMQKTPYQQRADKNDGQNGKDALYKRDH